jgi:hypothetical protein
MALRDMARGGRNKGQIQDVLTTNLRALLDVTDQLNASGWRPAQRFAGDEAALWAHAVRYACALPWQVPPADLPFDVVADDARRVREAWDRFAAFAAGLDADVFGTAHALDPQFFRPDRLAHLVGNRSGEAPPDHPGQFPGDQSDEAAFLVIPPPPQE